ncbi:hypothetical protein O181_020779 [Austropuccinia psidii MF-1]|uniref:Secreted protein n=1 Tax=Austropuccinia psidii MF-1 TaxID=1389203 RepID=A0A9Q3C9J6_9BASI|nr:hypothetical protein [Austropuccinia psidii MF-1]
MAHVWWHATVHLSWFLGLVQDPDASHANPYACPEFQRFTHKTLSCNSLHRGSLPTMHTIPYAFPGSQGFTCKILMLVQVPNASHTHPYACTGSRQFRRFLKPGQPPDNSKNFLHN